MPKSVWNKRQWLITSTACLFTALTTFAVSDYCHNKHESNGTAKANQCRLHAKALRIQDYRFAKPLLMVDSDDEDADLLELKGQLLSSIIQQKNSGNLIDAALYLRDLQTGNWIAINREANFDPGSILKLPILISHLKQEELTPGHLTKQFRLSSSLTGMPQQTIKGKSIEIGKAYTVRELLRYMIVESDNNANALLNQIADPNTVKKIFTDLGLPAPSIQQTQVYMSVEDVSRFMRLLYNATYLRYDLSEFALELLNETRFNEGIRAIATPNIPICSKFGERGQMGSDVYELHETSIVYLEDRPFVFTLMTRGSDRSKQEAAIQSISKLALRNMQGEVNSGFHGNSILHFQKQLAIAYL